MATRPQQADLTDVLLAEADYGDFEQADDPTLDTHVGEIVHRPDEKWGAPIGVSERRAEFVTIYSTLDGEPRVVNKNNLDAAMKKINNDPAYPHKLGTPAFSKRPLVAYRLGTHKCKLHPEHEEGNWPLYQSWGLKPCMSAHFPSEFEVGRHMQMDHKAEHAAIRDYEEKQQRERDRAVQNTILQTLAQRVAPEPVGVPDDAPKGRGKT